MSTQGPFLPTKMFRVVNAENRFQLICFVDHSRCNCHCPLDLFTCCIMKGNFYFIISVMQVLAGTVTSLYRLLNRYRDVTALASTCMTISLQYILFTLSLSPPFHTPTPSPHTHVRTGASIASSVICHPLHVIMMRQQVGAMATKGGMLGVYYSVQEAIETLGMRGKCVRASVRVFVCLIYSRN